MRLKTPLTLLLLFCGSSALAALKDHGATVGAMVLDPGWDEPERLELAKAEFNCITVGTFWSRTRPARGEFDWAITDEVLAAYPEMKVQLTPLIWPHEEQLPDWLTASPPAEAQAIMEEHIREAMTHYRDRADVWVVVNEAIARGSTSDYRDSWWSDAMGHEAYILEAFRLARQYDPDAVLLYNDFGMEYSNSRWEGVQRIVTLLHEEGLIDGLGWQMHISPRTDLSHWGEQLAWVAEQGLANYVTELDVTLADGGTLEDQAARYREVVEIWRPHAGGGWLQTWGVVDPYSWLGSAARPLLFDGDLQPKPAYSAVDEALAEPQ